MIFLIDNPDNGGLNKATLDREVLAAFQDSNKVKTEQKAPVKDSVMTMSGKKYAAIDADILDQMMQRQKLVDLNVETTNSFQGIPVGKNYVFDVNGENFYNLGQIGSALGITLPSEKERDLSTKLHQFYNKALGKITDPREQNQARKKIQRELELNYGPAGEKFGVQWNSDGYLIPITFAGKEKLPSVTKLNLGNGNTLDNYLRILPGKTFLTSEEFVESIINSGAYNVKKLKDEKALMKVEYDGLKAKYEFQGALSDSVKSALKNLRKSSKHKDEQIALLKQGGFSLGANAVYSPQTKDVGGNIMGFYEFNSGLMLGGQGNITGNLNVFSKAFDKNYTGQEVDGEVDKSLTRIKNSLDINGYADALIGMRVPAIGVLYAGAGLEKHINSSERKATKWFESAESGNRTSPLQIDPNVSYRSESLAVPATIGYALPISDKLRIHLQAKIVDGAKPRYSLGTSVKF